MSAGRPPPGSVRRLLRLAGVTPGGTASDRDLIGRFALDRDEGAFADLMARHGPMVLGVCRRHTRDPHLADDAFQATFLVLARRAGSVRWRESLGGWLYEVATRVSKKAAAQAARQRSREASADAAPEPAARPDAPPADLTALQAALDQELARLPEKLRLPVVLCHLEGVSQDEAARHLGLSDGQLRGRLYRAKLKLQDRLTRRGFTLTAVLLSLTVGPAAQALPPVLAAGTLRLAVAPGAVVPDAVLQLTLGVVQDMTFATKAVAGLLLVGSLGVGAAGVALSSAPGNGPAAPAPSATPAVAAKPDDDTPADPKDKTETVRGEIKTVDPTAFKVKLPNGNDVDGRGVLKVKPDDGGQPEMQVVLGADARLIFHGKPVKPADLKPGMRVELDYRGNSTDLFALRAEWRSRGVTVKGVDAAANALRIDTDGDGNGLEVPLAVAPDAAVTVDRLPAGLADVPAGRKADVSPSLDKKSVVRIDAQGDPADLPAVVVGYDSTGGKLLVSFEAEQGEVRRVVSVALPVAAGTKARLAGKDLPLAELKPRMPARLRLSADRASVVGLLVAAPLPEPKDDDKDD